MLLKEKVEKRNVSVFLLSKVCQWLRECGGEKKACSEYRHPVSILRRWNPQTVLILAEENNLSARRTDKY